MDVRDGPAQLARRGASWLILRASSVFRGASALAIGGNDWDFQSMVAKMAGPPRVRRLLGSLRLRAILDANESACLEHHRLVGHELSWGAAKLCGHAPACGDRRGP